MTMLCALLRIRLDQTYFCHRAGLWVSALGHLLHSWLAEYSKTMLLEVVVLAFSENSLEMQTRGSSAPVLLNCNVCLTKSPGDVYGH